MGMVGDAERSAGVAVEPDGLRHVDLSRTQIGPGSASLLSEETARRYRAVAIERSRDTTVVAVPDPSDAETMRAVRAALPGAVVAVAAPLDQLDAAIARIYGQESVRTSRRRGQHEARFGVDATAARPDSAEDRFASDPDDAPSANRDAPSANGQTARTVPFATADALLSGAASVRQPGTEGGGESGSATSLEEALREVLTPPVVDHRSPPMPAPPEPAAPPQPPPATATPQPPPAPAMPDTPMPGVVEHPTRLNGAAVPAPGVGPLTVGAPPVANGSGAPAVVEVAVPPPPPVLDDNVRSAVTSPDPGPSGTSPDQPPPLDGSVDQAGTTAVVGPPPPPEGFGAVGSSAPVPAPDLQWPPLARALVTLGRVSYADMVAALHAHREVGESLARYLYNRQLATEDDLVQAMAEEVGLEFVDLANYPVDPAVASIIPDAVARRHMVLPVRIEQGVPVVAMANPTDVFAMDDLRSIIGRNFTPVVSTRSQISAHLRSMQDSDTDVEEAAQSAAGGVAPGSGGFELESLQSVVEDAPIVRYVNLLILQALNERASDIHIEPSPRRLRIRFRIDGVMHDASSASPAIHQSVVSRLKVLGEMDITEHRLPQEGRVSVSVGDRQIDLRLATIPSLYGETCVMRLLDKSASIRSLPELGFLPDTLERYSHTYNNPYGVILVTGPTGAGKTTTLYATLQEVMSKEKSVVTVEDPVEYQIDGITQVQINQKAGMQFSTALRSILRADPDIILVGEIRDITTATIAMEAALSGHLVLSTLHTNTAAATPLRLTEMGIEPFLVTSAVSGVLTQRLARVLCDRCKTPYDASLADFYAAGYREVDLEGLDTSTLYRANGCRSCSHTGYHGRMVLAEVMQVTEEIERMIIEQQSIVAMERQAVEQGMRTLRQDGLRKALIGMTTLEEVLRVVV